MSEGIEIKAGIKAQTAAPRPDLHVKQDKPLPPNPSTANGSENGGVYLELNFRTERGRDRQQTLLTTFSVENSDETDSVSGENLTEPVSFLHKNSNRPTFYRGNSSHQNDYEEDSTKPVFDNTNYSNGHSYGIGGDNGNSVLHENSNRPIFYRGNSSHQNDYEEDSTEPVFYNTNYSNGHSYGIGGDNGNSVDKTSKWKELSLDNFVDLVENNKDFAEFRNQPRDFRREVRRFSETKNTEPNDENLPTMFDDSTDIFDVKDNKLKFFDESEDNSKLFEARKESVKFFDENDENDVKILDKRIEKDAPPNISEYEKLVAEMDAKKLSPAEFVEILPPKDREIFKARYQLDQTFGTKTSGEDVTPDRNERFQIDETGVEKNFRTFVSLKETNDFSPAGKIASPENNPMLTSRDIADSEGGIAPLSANTFVDSEPKVIESNDWKFQDKSSQVAVGGNVSSLTTENGATRTINQSVILDNSTSVSGIARCDGAALGGALISGAFTSIENYKNAESRGIGGSHLVGNADIYGRSVFSAGATGVMMSAAIGSVIPNADASVGGVLGFISSVVVGVEAEQGLRWLGGDRPTVVSLPDNAVNLRTGNLNRQPPLT